MINAAATSSKAPEGSGHARRPAKAKLGNCLHAYTVGDWFGDVANALHEVKDWLPTTCNQLSVANVDYDEIANKYKY